MIKGESLGIWVFMYSVGFGFLGVCLYMIKVAQILAKSYPFTSSRFHGLVITPRVFPRHSFQTCFISLFLSPVLLSISQGAGCYLDATRLDWECHILKSDLFTKAGS